MRDRSGDLLLDGASLTPLRQTPYDDEPLLQKALADYPELLAGPATSGDTYGRLLLVRREMPVPGGAPGLSLDHLFVDGEGVPVLVEVKRSSDTRSRREVVAQMLDYAANGTAYRPVDSLRSHLESRAGEGQDGSDVLAEHLGVEEPDRFWRTVEDNLRAGRVIFFFLTVGVIRQNSYGSSSSSTSRCATPRCSGSNSHSSWERKVQSSMCHGWSANGHCRGHQAGDRLWDAVEPRVHACRCRHSLPDQRKIALIMRLVDDVAARGGRMWWGNGRTAGFTGWYMIDGKDTPF